MASRRCLLLLFCCILSDADGFTRRGPPGIITIPSRPSAKTLFRQDDRRLLPAASSSRLHQQELSQLFHLYSSVSTTGDDLPENLRRKVRASRPTLGHVVPKAARGGATAGGSSEKLLRPQGKRREAGRNNPSLLQISAGSAKGRRLDSPNVYLRPMMSKVREAVYSTLTSFGLYDPTVASSTRHLDLFAGSGSVGLESLSRGASHCTFVDLSSDCCATVQRNSEWCNLADRTSVICADALAALREPAKVGIPPDTTFQIVTICPPYEEVVYADLLEAVVNSDLVADDTVVLVEYPVELGCLPHVIQRQTNGGAMVGVRNRRYGRTVIAMYVVNPTGRLKVAASRPEEFVKI